MANKEFGVTPLGDGLYKMGEDIVCAYKLKGTILDLSNHKITFNYPTYKVEVTWTENTDGVRTDPHWQRIYLNQGGNS